MNIKFRDVKTRWSVTFNYPDDKPLVFEGILEIADGTYEIRDIEKGTLLMTAPFASLKYILEIP